MAVDDEADVLAVLEDEILYSSPSCKLDKATTYTEAAKLLESRTYDLVILDIMGVQGFDLLTLAVSRNFQVVMLTAHALSPEALRRSYELRARAYLPKDKLGEVVPFLEDVLNYDHFPGWRNLILKPNLFSSSWPHHPENWSWPLSVYTLGEFELVKEGEPVRFLRKVKRKPLLLLKALIALGGKDVREERIADMLWPEAEGDAAHSAFTTTLSRLRQLLGTENAIKFQEGKATLDPLTAWVDAWAFERIHGQAEALWTDKKRLAEERPGQEDDMTEVVQLTEKAFSMYKGHFLSADEEHFWTTSYRERLRNKYLGLIRRFVEYLKETDQWEKALEFCQKALEVDDLAEELYQQIMVCFRQLNQNAQAIAAYQRCKETLSSALGIEPSPKTKAIYKTLTASVK